MRALTLLLLVACSGPDETTDNEPLTEADRIATFEAFGPHAVAYRERSVTYTDPTGGERTFRLGLWYPTTANSGATASFAGPRAPKDVWLEGAPEHGPWPIWLFSHGHQGNHDNTSRQLAHAASHGWVAIAPEHTGNTLADGSVRTTELYLQRITDSSAALDDVLRDDASLGGVTDEIFGTGHSFGGYSMFPLAGAGWDVDHWDRECAGSNSSDFCSTWTPTLAALFRAGATDDRIAAFATLSGGNYDQLRDGGLALVDRPLLQVSGALDGSVSNEGSSDPIWAALPAGNKLRVDLAHGDHQTYTDFAATASGIIPGTHPDVIEAERGYRILDIYLHAFAAAHVLGETDGLAAILDGSLEIDPDVTHSTK